MLNYKSDFTTTGAEYGGVAVSVDVSGSTYYQIPVNLESFIIPAFSPDGTINSGGSFSITNIIPSGD